MGPAGVPNCKVRAWLTMPEMPGMPEMRPAWHAEGVPGDYGIVADFPHGGSYALRLEITPPGAKPFVADFKLEVKDERSSKGKPAAKPFLLQASTLGPATSGMPTVLKFTIVDGKTKTVVRDFDVAHTKRFHLLLASKDFGWFLHEHPEQGSDGSWTVTATFPSGGDYWAYGDVAPVGKGSMILASTVRIAGPRAIRQSSWEPNLGPATDAGVMGNLVLPSDGVPVGITCSLSVRLRDAASGAALSDLEPWLGAMGHLMIFSADGATVVHSHPEDRPVMGGVVKFNARFPKPGRYRAFAQFSRGGLIKTLRFTIEVKA